LLISKVLFFYGIVSDLNYLYNGDSVGRMTYILYASVMGAEVTNDDVIDIMYAVNIKINGVKQLLSRF